MQFAIPAESVVGAFGDGSDGDFTTPTGVTTTLTRDMKYRNLTITTINNTRLHTNGFIVQVQKLLTFSSNAGTNTGIDNDAAGNVPGGTGTLFGGAAPPSVVSTVGNSPPGNSLAGVIGGGNGGVSSGALAGGSVTPSGLIIPGPDLVDAILTGGGSGAAGTVLQAGAAGGVVLLLANQIQVLGAAGGVTALVSARGGNKTSATSGDGGGGVVVVGIGSAVSGTLTTDVGSGAPGVGGNGNAGKAFIVPIVSS